MMSDTSLWLSLSDRDEGLLHVWIGIENHKGRHVLVMRAEDQGRPTIVAELDRLKALRLANASAMNGAGGGGGNGRDPSDDSPSP